MEQLPFATIKDLREKLDAGQINSEELLDFFLRRFTQYDREIGSSLECFSKDSIMYNARQQGPLAGIPGIIKDNITQKGRLLTCGSKILEHFVATYDATVVSRLKEAGARIIGRANMDEFAMGSSTETSAFKKTKNPWNSKKVPGGSSGGSIAAVAAGLVPWALGSETGGSVRQPAAFCGIVGMKPTYGLVSRYGLVAYASSLDQIGIATRTVYDNALVFSTIAGHDLKDSSTLFVSKKDYTKKLNGSVASGLKIGVVQNALNQEQINDDIKESVVDAIGLLASLGAEIKNIEIPILEYSAAAYFIISRAEAASNLARFDGVRYGLRHSGAKALSDMYLNTRHDGFGDEVKSRIMIGNYVLSAGNAGQFYSNAKKVQRLIRRAFIETFNDVDLIVMPTHPMPAFSFGAFDVNPLQMDLQDYFTCPANLAGIPAISIPCGFTKDNLPIGFQLLGPHLSEALLYQTAYAYEQSTQWHTMHPTHLGVGDK